MDKNQLMSVITRIIEKNPYPKGVKAMRRIAKRQAERLRNQRQGRC